MTSKQLFRKDSLSSDSKGGLRHGGATGCYHHNKYPPKLCDQLWQTFTPSVMFVPTRLSPSLEVLASFDYLYYLLFSSTKNETRQQSGSNNYREVVFNFYF